MERHQVLAVLIPIGIVLGIVVVLGVNAIIPIGTFGVMALMAATAFATGLVGTPILTANN